ncbi:MAG: preprotein translocase, SecA subunit, partial [Verrucomicrobiaceae bacterium]|nr:preprotein translocase, SecA subunit [Verrucomicrobiaceae bacterium]
EYKKEAYDLFATLMTNIHYEVMGNLFRSATSLQAFEDFLQTLQSGGTSGPNRTLSAPAPDKPKNPKSGGGKNKGKRKEPSATELKPSLSSALAAVSQTKPTQQNKTQTRTGG